MEPLAEGKRTADLTQDDRIKEDRLINTFAGLLSFIRFENIYINNYKNTVAKTDSRVHNLVPDRSDF